MRVSIIIPAFNAERTIGECVAACVAQTHRDCEVIVVDDGSTDGTAEIVREFVKRAAGAIGTVGTIGTDEATGAIGESVRCLCQENKGPAAARNLGAAHATGDVFAFTDSDCVPWPDWIEQLLKGFAENVVGVGGAYDIANPDSFLARMLHEEIGVRHDRSSDEVDFLGSFNVVYQRSAFEAAGGFDESFSKASAEDNDLSYRLRDAGERLRFRREAVVAHYHPDTLWPYLRTQARHGYWRMKLYRKHPYRTRTGDQYANMIDLSAPPLALSLCLMLIAQNLVGPYLSFPNFLAAVAYGFVRVPLAIRMSRRAEDRRMYAFLWVALLRDTARALGMIAGIVRFFICPVRS
jgi:cellulose synthase/poly-beta-1,6-N-acetylglucosamine synthase-like glycosyltransferase